MSFGGGAATALSAATYRRVLGANDRVGVGFAGFGLIGKRRVLDFRNQVGAGMRRAAARFFRANFIRSRYSLKEVGYHRVNPR
jgi:hypothetical protein